MTEQQVSTSFPLSYYFLSNTISSAVCCSGSPAAGCSMRSGDHLDILAHSTLFVHHFLVLVMPDVAALLYSWQRHRQVFGGSLSLPSTHSSDARNRVRSSLWSRSELGSAGLLRVPDMSSPRRSGRPQDDPNMQDNDVRNNCLREYSSRCTSDAYNKLSMVRTNPAVLT